MLRENSKVNKVWIEREGRREEAKRIAKELRISETLAEILTKRGIFNSQDAYRFLYPKLSDLSDPYLLPDIEKAAKRLLKAVKDEKLIGIYGDYDVDGVCGSAILYLFIKELGGKVKFYAPDRISEGYGLNENLISKMKNDGVSLVVTVDCGICDLKESRLIKSQNMDLIITDHHMPGRDLPCADCIVNPKLGNSNSIKDLCGASVAFYLAAAIRREIRRGALNMRLPELKTHLDLVALATIADLVPLLGDNRILAKYGLKQLSTTNKIGLLYLKEVCKLGREIDTFHVGFILGPRINASSRMADARAAFRLLVTDSESEARKLATYLDELNKERQRVEERVLKEAILMVDEKDFGIVLFSPGWHPGIIGIVASRIVDMYSRPTVIISGLGEKSKGSARSIEGIHIYDVLCECKNLLLGFGGHRLAAGLTIEPSNIEKFKERFNEILKNYPKEQFCPKLLFDKESNLNSIRGSLIKEIELLSPFGEGNPKPLFVARNLQLTDIKEIGQNFLKLKVKEGIFTYDAFWTKKFNGNFLNPPKRVDLLFSPKIGNLFGQSYLELSVVDIKPKG